MGSGHMRGFRQAAWNERSVCLLGSGSGGPFFVQYRNIVYFWCFDGIFLGILSYASPSYIGPII